MDTQAGMIVSLAEEAGRLPATEVGGKAATLARLIGLGFPVPPGSVLTVEAHRQFLAANGLGIGSAPEDVLAARVPEGLVKELTLVLESLPGPVAVRSSGVAEDLATASYAGQYATVLDVQDLPTAIEAVRRCWASAHEAHVLRYHRERGHDSSAAMAVVIQQMVRADAAGVVFGANPVTGDRDEVVINAVPGLGDELAAGSIDPEQWSVRRDRATRVPGAAEAIVAQLALRLAQVVRDVERQLGRPQDLEWAFADGAIHILQSRPITNLPQRPARLSPAPEGYWEAELSHAPRPWTPFTSSLIYELRNEPLRDVLAGFGLLVEAIEFRDIGGWDYMRLVPVGGKDRRTPPAWLAPLLFKAVPALRKRVNQSVSAVRDDTAGRLIDRWYAEWHPDLSGRISVLGATDLGTLTDEELLTNAEAATDLVRDGARIHFTLHAAICFPLAELAFATTDLVGWAGSRTWELLAGTSTMSTAPSRRLGELATDARSRPAVRQWIGAGGPGGLGRLEAIDPDYCATLVTYLQDYGTRALAYEMASPALSDQPELVLRLLADQIAAATDADATTARLALRRESAVAEARAALKDVGPADRARWERALERAIRAYPVREDNEFYTMSAPIALLHSVATEIGRRLVDQSRLETAEDVFYLTHDEARGALDSDQDWRPLVATRRAEMAWVSAHPGPAAYGTKPAAPPSLDALPPEARFANEALLWYAQEIFAADHARDEACGGVRGIAASPGRYRGPVRVIRSETEFGKLQPGDVLVCPVTSPVWSVLFPSIGALVTDVGGALSHPAIIAREYGVPAVVATGSATERLTDGVVVTVDGSTGLVTVD